MILGKAGSKSSENVTKFDCKEFSCFPDEQETLFFGEDTQLKIKGILQFVRTKWESYGKFMDPMNAFHRFVNGKSLENQQRWSSDSKYGEHKKNMNCIVKALLHAQLKQEDGECPAYVLRLGYYQKSSAKHIRLVYSEMKSGYQWMRYILKSGSNLNFANIAALFHEAESITFVVSDTDDLQEEEWEFVVTNLTKIREMELSMEFRFELSSDKYRQRQMHDMIVYYLAEKDSKWRCNHNDNILTFHVDEGTAMAEDSELFRNTVQRMIEELNEAMGVESKLEKGTEKLRIPNSKVCL